MGGVGFALGALVGFRLNPRITTVVSCIILGLLCFHMFLAGVIARPRYPVAGAFGAIALACQTVNLGAIGVAKLQGVLFPVRFLRGGFTTGAAAQTVSILAILVVSGGPVLTLLVTAVILLAPHWLQVALIWLLPKPFERPVSEPPPEATVA